MNSNRWPAEFKARIVTALFLLVGIISITLRPIQWMDTLPLFIFYLTITVNTYFSIRFFAKLTPEDDCAQRIVDIVLVALYLLLAASLTSPIVFSFFALAIFIAAPIKYVLLLGRIPHITVLRKKLLIDLCGTTLCALVFAGMCAGFILQGSWIVAIVFLIANIYLLLINPMYRS